MAASAPMITNNGSPKAIEMIKANTTNIPVDISEPPLDLFHVEKE